MMRLLYLTAETWPTHRADLVALFGKYLPRYDIYADLVGGRTPNSGSIAWGGGDAVLCDPSGGDARKHIRFFLHSIQQVFRADRDRYAAIQVRDLAVTGAVGLVAARLKRLPFFYWMSYPMVEGQISYARERGLSRGLMKFLFPWVRGRVGRFLLYRFVLPRADHIFVQSERMKQDMIERGVTPEKMTPVPMGVDLEAMRSENIAPADDPRLAGRRVLTYLGTLASTRRIEVLFDMLARVRQEEPSALLVLVGEAEDEQQGVWLKQQAKIAGVAEHVLWAGWLAMREAWRYVSAAEVALSPIPRGPLLDVASPTKVLEYLALGVPVVCNDNPDQQTIMAETGAGHCVPYTGEDFAKAALDLLAIAPPDRQKMAASGAEYIQSMRDYNKIAMDVESIYRNIINDGTMQQEMNG